MMKFKKIILVLSLAVSGVSFASKTDSLVYDLGEYKVYLKGDVYCVESDSGKSLYKNLKFFGRAVQYWQVLDKKNELFYLDNEMKKADTKDNFIGLCGTVPHYTLRIKSTKNEFIIMEDETFYDYGNKIQAEEKFRISKKEADEIYFINGKKEFNYDGNYGFSGTNVQPDLVIYKKNEKFGIWQDKSKELYDEIHFENSNLKLKKEGKFGFYGFTEIKYRDI